MKHLTELADIFRSSGGFVDINISREHRGILLSKDKFSQNSNVICIMIDEFINAKMPEPNLSFRIVYLDQGVEPISLGHITIHEGNSTDFYDWVLCKLFFNGLLSGKQMENFRDVFNDMETISEDIQRILGES